MTEANGYIEQTPITERFREPQVHPDVDSYMREKIAHATRVKQRHDEMASSEWGRNFFFQAEDGIRDHSR